MTRGKYSAKARNRASEESGRVITELESEITRLKKELADTQARLQAEQRERNTLALARAEELSAGAIAASKKEVEEIRRQAAAELQEFMEPVQELDKEDPRYLRRYGVLEDRRRQSVLGRRLASGNSRGVRSALSNKRALKDLEGSADG